MINPKVLRLDPIIKYPGGKERELKYILPALPENAHNFYDPFVGGGAVYLAVEAEHYFINDFSEELMLLYSCAKKNDGQMFEVLYAFCDAWDHLTEASDSRCFELTGLYQLCARILSAGGDISEPVEEFIDRFIMEETKSFAQGSFLRNWWFGLDWRYELTKSFINKFRRMNELEEKKGMLSQEDCFKNLETCLKNAFYMYLRARYNNARASKMADGERAALYFFIREYCYSSMFRYNSKQEFNVPYGGISYNRKSIRGKVDALASADMRAHLSKTELGNTDFLDFMRSHKPGREDFVFVDPPYDTKFSTYDGAAFDQQDHKRLADYLCNECEARFLMVIKNTEYIRKLYTEGYVTKNGSPIYLYKFDKKYFVSFMARNDKKSEHLMIANYPLL